MDEKELLTRVTEDKDFVQRVLEDTLDDWAIAREWAELVLRVEPEDLVHRLALVRAYRHLGHTDLAISELERCVRIIESGDLGVVDREVVIPMVEGEKRLLLPSS